MFPATSLPNLHPALVHFPIAFISLGVLVELLGLCFRKQFWLDKTALLLYWAAALGALAAYLAGRQATDSVGILPPTAEALLAQHSDWGLYTLIAFSLLAAIRSVISWIQINKTGQKLFLGKILALSLALTAQWVLFQTADRGGALVYGHAVAVAKKTIEASKDELAPAVNGLLRTEDGSLIWKPSSTDTAAIGSLLISLDGQLERNVSPVFDSINQDGIGIKISGNALLLFPGSYGDVQIQGEFDLTRFKGKLALVHHFQDVSDKEWFEISDLGQVKLVSETEGKLKILDSHDSELKSPVVNLTLSAAGRHLKASVNGQLAVHGHRAVPRSGQVGLLAEGEGIIRINEIQITPLETE